MKINILYFTILFCIFLNSLYLKAVPNSGTLLNFENELNNFLQICPKEMLDKLENPISIKSMVKEVS